MFYQLADEQPVVLILAEPGLLTELVTEFFQANDLRVELIKLDRDFFLNYKQFAQGQRSFYKVVFIYGFSSYSRDVYRCAFDFLDLLKNKNQNLPIILISQTSTSLDLIDNLGAEYQSYLRKQNLFIKDFLHRFNQSLIFLGQDILLNDKRMTYPLLLFFSTLQQNYVCDLQSKFYFQDEKSFFVLIKDYLIKPHVANHFIIKGRALSSTKLANKIGYLYEQYFQQSLHIVRLVTNDKPQIVLKEFSSVVNSKSQYEGLLDQKIRALVDHDKDLQAAALSELELQKALEVSRLRRLQQRKSLKAKNSNSQSKVQLSPELLNEARLSDKETPQSKSFDAEFINKIEQLFSTQRTQEKGIRQAQNLTQGQTIIKKSKKRKLLFWLGLSGFSLSFICLVLLLLFNLSKTTLEKRLLTAVNQTDNIENIDKSVIYRFFNFQLWQYQQLFSDENLSEALEVKNLNDTLNDLYISEKTSHDLAFDLYQKTFESGVALEEVYTKLLNSLDQQIAAQKAFASYLAELNLDLYPEGERAIWQESINSNKVTLKNLTQTKLFLTAFKPFMLQGGRVNWAILLQDSSELRSSGGFLTEIAVLSFENGNLVDQQILDVDDLDNRIYGHKEASQEIKDLLGEEVLYLRDSNWPADFIDTSQEIGWFIQQATGSSIDFIAALNSQTLTGLLQLLGEIRLNNGKTIDANNYLTEHELSAETDYSNTSSEKFDWQLLTAIMTKLANLNQTEFTALSVLLIDHLNQREILLQSSNQELSQVFQVNSWNGEELEPTCPTEFSQERCLLDSLYQLENNVGVNKVNPYIKETIEHNVGISEQFIRHKRTIIWENLAKSNLWPLGTYRDYLKFYLPSQVTIEKIELNDQDIDAQKVRISSEDTKQVLAVLLEIPPQQQIKLSLTYLVPNPVDQKAFSYVFLDQKQAGIFYKNTNYNIVFSDQFKPQLIAPTANYQDKIINFGNDNSDHFLFAINFAND